MTFSSFRKRSKRDSPRTVICHYCNQSDSRLVQDGTVREWQCEKCLSTNYYDENGQISDPPNHVVAGNNQARYAYSRHSQNQTQPPLTNHPFCETCLKNQHLYTASLAQYHISLRESEDPFAEESTRQQIKQIEANLADRYPQVCSACEPGVIAQIKRGHYKAQTDNLGKVLQRLRPHSPPNSSKPQRAEPWKWGEVVYAPGRLSWWLAVLLQLAWSLTVILKTDNVASSSDCSDEYLHCDPEDSAWDERVRGIIEFLELHLSLFANCTIVLGVLTSFWNPQYKPGSLMRSQRAREWHHQWFRLQAAYFGIRFFLHQIGCKETTIFSFPMIRILHGVAIAFTIMIASVARQSLRTNFRQGLRLVKSPSQRVKQSQPLGVGFGSLKMDEISRPTAKRNEYELSLGNTATAVQLRGLEDDSDHILPSPIASDTSEPQSWQEGGYSNSKNNDAPPALLNLFNLSLGKPTRTSAPAAPTTSSTSQPLRIESFFSNMSPEQGDNWLQTGQLPTHMLEEMDWESAPVEHQFNAPRQPHVGPFAPARVESSPAGPSPFRQPVPDAPFSWSRRTYNPPAPRAPPAPAARENPFLNQPTAYSSFHSNAAGATKYPELARQRFFYNPEDLPIDGLADDIDKFEISLTPTQRRAQRDKRLPSEGAQLGLDSGDRHSGMSRTLWAVARIAGQLVLILAGAQVLATIRGETSWQFWTFVVFLIGLVANGEIPLWRH